MAFIVKCRRILYNIIITAAVTCIYCRRVHKRYSLIVVTAVVAPHVAHTPSNITILLCVYIRRRPIVRSNGIVSKLYYYYIA